MGAPEGNRNARKGETADVSYLHVRVERRDKSRWVRKAQRRGLKLAEWVRQALDDACRQG